MTGRLGSRTVAAKSKKPGMLVNSMGKGKNGAKNAIFERSLNENAKFEDLPIKMELNLPFFELKLASLAS